MPSPYWENQTAPLYGATRTLGAGIASLPMMRAIAQQRAAMAGYYSARGQELQQAGAEAAEKTRVSQLQTQEEQDFADSAARAVPTFSDANAKPEDRTAAATDLMRKAGRLAAKDPNKAMTIFDNLVQRMQANPTDQVQQFEANNPGKLVTGSDVLTDQQLAAAQAAKEALKSNPIDAAATGTMAANLPGNVIKSFEQSNPPPNAPQQPGQTTAKPFPLTISQALQSKLQNTFTSLVQSGTPPAIAEGQAKALVLGTNATTVPVTTTNQIPAIPGTGLRGYPSGTPYIPPRSEIETNSFAVQPGGQDMTISAALMKNPRTAAVMQQLGLAPASASPATGGETQTGTSQFNSPEDVRAAYHAGKLDRAGAAQILQSQFGMQ